MNKFYNNIFTIFIFCFLGNTCLAQTFIGKIDFDSPTQKHFVILKNKSEFFGRILSINNSEIKFQEEENDVLQIFFLESVDKIYASREGIDISTEEGRIELSEAENNEIKYLSEEYQNEGDHRLLYAETGFGLREGTSEYRTIWGLAHNVEYGISDGISAGLGYIHPGFFTSHFKFNYIGSYLHSKFRAGFDFKTALKPEKVFDDSENKFKTEWEGYIQMTSFFSYGTPSRNAHIAINIIPLLENGQFFEGGLITFSFGGTIKLAEHWKLIYENNFGFLEANVTNFGLFSGLGANWHKGNSSIKFAIHSSPNFGFFNIPINDLNTTSRLPFLSYSRFF